MWDSNEDNFSTIHSTESSSKASNVLSRTGDAIRQARSARGISEAELAKDIGISKEFLCAMEAGQKRPTLEILLLIALRLEIAPKQIYGTIGDDPKAARLTEHSDMIMDLYEAAKKIRR
jgi:transcriptional regulator with XRE-family HTH domain